MGPSTPLRRKSLRRVYTSNQCRQSLGNVCSQGIHSQLTGKANIPEHCSLCHKKMRLAPSAGDSRTDARCGSVGIIRGNEKKDKGREIGKIGRRNRGLADGPRGSCWPETSGKIPTLYKVVISSRVVLPAPLCISPGERLSAIWMTACGE